MADMEDKNDPAHIPKALDAELALKRIEWQRTAEKRRAARALSFVFLALVIIGALLGFMFFMSQLQGRRDQERPAIAATPAP